MSAIIEELSSYLNSSEVLKVKVSNWSVGAHIEHCTKVIVGICSAISKSDPKDYKSKFNLAKTLCFTFNKFPRGKAKAPKAALPTLSADQETLQKFLVKAEEKMQTIQGLPSDSHFTHPYFGHINLKDSQRFFKMHTDHHIAIIKDIIKAAR